MPNTRDVPPRQYAGVMVSSTFTDLKDHRSALITAIRAHDFKDVAMENDSAKPDVDVIESSLQMVQKASAYIGVIGRKYGQTPICPIKNPEELSVTELEFNEAQRLGRPILLFIMSEKHSLREADVELDPSKREKLNAFRERAKLIKPESQLHRIYAKFDSLEDFARKATQSVGELSRYLDENRTRDVPSPPVTPEGDTDKIPKPPAFYAEPRYSGSHDFVGRRDQLQTLDEWALPADSHPVLLFDAIGGSGKSMLTWEWANKHATEVRKDWAGIFWYSFYERGAIMADFCRYALAYMTGRPLQEFRKKKTPELSKLLLRELDAKPWLLILDGLERVLVAYHRIDAAEVLDEEIDQPTDQIASRDPFTAIRPEDDDLLRALATAAPSKVLITSRLVPRVMLNAANQPVPGVLRESLRGLRPLDAEALFRSCGVTGSSQAMQSFLKSHCDCHPLVTGVLAGLVNDYLPDRGNFDAWEHDPAGGGQLNLANLNLIQKRNHILKAAIDNLPAKSRELLSILALLSEAVDYPTLSAFNPHLPAEPEEVEVLRDPRNGWDWKWKSDADKKVAEREYQAAVERHKTYEAAMEDWRRSPEVRAASHELAKTVCDLERRGLLQYDHLAKRHDLHPVVRGIAAGGLRQEERDGYGRRVVDHFSAQAHSPYDEAETLDDLRNGMHIVRTLLRMSRFQEAADAYQGYLADALFINLEAFAETLALLRPFFPEGWSVRPAGVDRCDGSYLMGQAGAALVFCGEIDEAMAAWGAVLTIGLRESDWLGVGVNLTNVAFTLRSRNHLALSGHYCALALDLATVTAEKERIFVAHLSQFCHFAMTGQWSEALISWAKLDVMDRNWRRSAYRPGDAEFRYAQFHFWSGQLNEADLVSVEKLAKAGKNRVRLRDLYNLRGEWHFERGEWTLAADSLGEAVSMARAVGKMDVTSETLLALARLKLGELSDPRYSAEQLAAAKDVSSWALGELWFAIGDVEQSRKHALAAYRWAWADGEPYVRRYELDKAKALLEKLNVAVPKLPVYDAAKREKFPWEDELVAAIERLRAEEKAESDGVN